MCQRPVFLLPGKFRKQLIVTILFLLSNPSFAQSVSQITDLVLITGQSNVRGTGAGTSSGSSPGTDYDPALDTVNAKVFAYASNAYTGVVDWQVADLHQAWDVNGWHPGNGTLDPYGPPDTEPYNNFAFHFAKTIVENDPTRVVGIIVASAPGKGIGNWDAGSTFSQTVANKVTEALNAQGIKTGLDAILWHQGETDWQYTGTSDELATDAEKSHPTYYPEKLQSLIANFRAQSWYQPGLPFICGETKQSPVNGHLNALNFDNDPWTACVKATDLSTKDNVHFDGAGLRALGKRYGEKYLEMHGITNDDNVAPEISTYWPVSGSILPTGSLQIHGGATDTGGSAVASVRVAIKNLQTNHWLNFDNGQFSSNFNFSNGNLTNSAISATDWHIDVNLNSGNYKLLVQATDHSGNYATVASGARKYTNTVFTISNDSQPPTTTITSPNVFTDSVQELTGTATDTGGSGIDHVRIAVKNKSDGSWLNFTTQTFENKFEHGNAVTSNPDQNNTEWSLTTNLTEGEYKLFALAVNNSGNYLQSGNGGREYTVKSFSVGQIDTTPPQTVISSSTELTGPQVTLIGSATDTGNSGIQHVRVAIKQISSNHWMNFDNGSLAPAFRHGQAILLTNSGVNANWELSALLPDGEYKLFAQAVDEAGNFMRSTNSSRLYTILRFTVSDNT